MNECMKHNPTSETSRVHLTSRVQCFESAVRTSSERIGQVISGQARLLNL